MDFTSKEKQAIVKVANMMIAADGKTDITEVLFGASIFQRLNITQVEITASDTIKPSDAIHIISQMSFEQKRFVMAFLGCQMIVDGNMAESELTLLSLISSACELPRVTKAEGIQIIKELMEK